jgi:microcin C transport system substrate-binding protein
MKRITTTIAALAVLAASAVAASAEDAAKGPDGLPPPGEWRHAVSLIGEPGYPAGFAHFNYVNPEAPKGGAVRISGASQTFDTLNPVLDKGVIADGLGLIYQSLTTRAFDESDIAAEYGEIAEALRYPPDYSYVTYRLNPQAKWNDGEPITADDVVWSFEQTVKLNQSQRFYYRHVTKAEATAPGEVTFVFDEKGNRELPEIVGELLILPRHWWEGTDANGNKRDIAKGTLEPTLGSGPYRVADVQAGRSITYERVPDFWAKDLNVNVGSYNFDKVTYEYYRDLNVEFEAFKADDFDYWWENEAKRWATAYDFPAIQAGKVKKEEVRLAQDSGNMVGFVPNLRRPFFQNRLVRQALNYAFDFEELNRTIFYGQYERVNSFFYGLPLAASGLPEGKELEILNQVKDKVPPDVFTTPYANPVGGTPEKVRDNLRHALELMQQAGYTLKGNRLTDKNGQPVVIELLLNGPTIERVALPYQKSLARIGITLNIRSVDSSQFVTRVRSRDFDMVYLGWGESNSPGNEQLSFWGSEAADSQASQNYAGIKDPAVDAIINQILFAKDRESQVAAVHALDRVMMAQQYVIPSYLGLTERIAYWDRFGHPDFKALKFQIGFPTVWWWDADKAAKIGGAQ